MAGATRPLDERASASESGWEMLLTSAHSSNGLKGSARCGIVLRATSRFPRQVVTVVLFSARLLSKVLKSGRCNELAKAAPFPAECKRYFRAHGFRALGRNGAPSAKHARTSGNDCRSAESHRSVRVLAPELEPEPLAMSLQLQVIICSTRPGRVGPGVSRISTCRSTTSPITRRCRNTRRRTRRSGARA